MAEQGETPLTPEGEEMRKSLGKLLTEQQPGGWYNQVRLVETENADGECTYTIVPDATHDPTHRIDTRLVMEGLRRAYKCFDTVWISRKNDDGTLSHFGIKAIYVFKMYKKEKTYRSGHSKVYKTVNGVWPDGESYKKWMGWSYQNKQPQFFSCTLNTPDGHSRQLDKARKFNVEDLMSPDDFKLLVKSFSEEIDVSRRGSDQRALLASFTETYYRVQSGVENQGTPAELIKIKKAGKLHVYFDSKLEPSIRAKAGDYFVAAIKGNLEALEAILPQVDKDIRDNDGQSALIWAATNNHLECVKYLAAQGCNLDFQGKDKMTALLQCVYKSQTHKVGCLLLISLGANLDLQDKHGVTAAIRASVYLDADILRALVEAGADLSIEDNYERMVASHAPEIFASTENGEIDKNKLSVWGKKNRSYGRPMYLRSILIHNQTEKPLDVAVTFDHAGTELLSIPAGKITHIAGTIKKELCTMVDILKRVVFPESKVFVDLSDIRSVEIRSYSFSSSGLTRLEEKLEADIEYEKVTPETPVWHCFMCGNTGSHWDKCTEIGTCPECGETGSHTNECTIGFSKGQFHDMLL